MPRHNRRRREQERTASAGALLGGASLVQWRGEDWRVMPITGAAAGKEYRCPGCDQLVRVGQGHVVVWADHDADADDRRHWHTTCWAARERRAPGVQRSRSAPRYGR